jgi:signal transduction histidine kinase
MSSPDVSSMSTCMRIAMLSLAGLLGVLCEAYAVDGLPAARTNQLLEIRSMSVNNQPMPLRSGAKFRLTSSVRNVSFGFGPGTNTEEAPLRIRYKLDNFDDDWREVQGDMGISVRYIDSKLDQVSERFFRVVGQTARWTGALETSAFVHRHETAVVPPGAKAFWIVMTSAGPPNSVGIYAITNFVVTRAPTDGQAPATVLEWSSRSKCEQTGAEYTPADWVRSGLRVGMAKIIPIGPSEQFKALALLDNDPTAHAEWTTRKEVGVPVAPGDRLDFDWDEASSIGLSGFSEVNYPELPAGSYRFRINELTLAGLPGEAETSLAFEVPLSLWRTPWFLGLLTLLVMTGVGGAYRYAVWQQMRRQLARLESQRALEYERLRIARDIHDDLGARVTQISLVSGLAQSDHNLSEKARADFNTISGMARELVSALYETVWAVNPENDNLDALGNYICQMVDNLCDKAQLRRRLRVAELPRDIIVSSHLRHHLIMAVKEAVHNVIKHARANELAVIVVLEGAMLEIRIQDDGSGFDPASAPAGNGLANMRRRLEQIGGTCTIQSAPGQGTTVSFQANLSPVPA